jgi:hypothetical protein
MTIKFRSYRMAVHAAPGMVRTRRRGVSEPCLAMSSHGSALLPMDRRKERSRCLTDGYPPGIHPLSSTTFYPKHATAPRSTSLYRSKYKPSEWLLMSPRISELSQRPESFSSLLHHRFHTRGAHISKCAILLTLPSEIACYVAL